MYEANWIIEEIKEILLAIYWIMIAAYRALLPIGYLERKNVEGSIILITGAGNGLGRELSKRLAKSRPRLVLWDMNETGVEETAKMCREFGAECYAYVVDVSNREMVYKTADLVKKEVGDVEILINNAGIINQGVPFTQATDEHIRKLVDVNILGNVWMIRSFLPAMVEKNNGHIVTISSASGLFGSPGLVDYGMTKFAITGLTEGLQHELITLEKDGIKTTTICPFYFNSDLLANQTLPDRYTVLDMDLVAERAIEAILTETEILIVPRKLYLLYAGKGALPTRLYRRLVMTGDI